MSQIFVHELSAGICCWRAVPKLERQHQSVGSSNREDIRGYVAGLKTKSWLIRWPSEMKAVYAQATDVNKLDWLCTQKGKCTILIQPIHESISTFPSLIPSPSVNGHLLERDGLFFIASKSLQYTLDNPENWFTRLPRSLSGAKGSWDENKTLISHCPEVLAKNHHKQIICLMSAVTPDEHCCLQNSVRCTPVHIEPQNHMTEEPMAIAGRYQSLIRASVCAGSLITYTTANLAAAAVIVGLSGFLAARGPEVDHSWRSLVFQFAVVRASAISV